MDLLSACQHPGSPGWPQQLLAVSIFVMVFLNTNQIFRWSGIVTWRLVRNRRALGLGCFEC